MGNSGETVKQRIAQTDRRARKYITCTTWETKHLIAHRTSLESVTYLQLSICRFEAKSSKASRRAENGTATGDNMDTVYTKRNT